VASRFLTKLVKRLNKYKFPDTWIKVTDLFLDEDLFVFTLDANSEEFKWLSFEVKKGIKG
jgi:hypothetical protein